MSCTLSRPKSLGDSLIQYEHCPSIDNKFLYAKALLENSQFEKSMRLFEEIIANDSSHQSARYGAALCKSELEELQEAERYLEEVIRENPMIFESQAALDLARLYKRTGKFEKAVSLLQDLVKRSARAPLYIELASTLHENGRGEQAKQVLQSCIHEYRHAPKYLRRQHKAALKEADRMLAAL